MKQVINSCQKGKAGERELAHELSGLFGVNCHRTEQHCGKAGDDDVTGLPGIFCECKREQRLNISKAISRAAADCPDGKVPIVFHRRNREPWLVTLRLDDLPSAVEKLFHTLASKEC